MTRAYPALLDTLTATGAKVIQRGDTKATAQCPAHEDHNPSLSITDTDTRVLVKCHAGCHVDDVLTALKLTTADLYDGDAREYAHYTYTDRVVHRGPDKKFWQTGQNGSSPTTLYRLDKVKAAVAASQPVYLVEGEADVEALETLGVVATTAPMGSSSFRRCDVTPLAHATVIVVPDNDPAGGKWLNDVQMHLESVGAEVTVAHPVTGKDASDHVAAGHGAEELIVEHTTPTPGRRIVLTAASDIKPRRVHWVWEGRLALGTLALLAGPEGLGKSALTYWLAAQITHGTLPGEFKGKPRGVLICATEDSWEHTVVPRLIAAGADLTRVFRVEVLNADDIHVGLSLPRDMHQVEQAAQQIHAALLILDPLLSRLDADLDTHKDAQVRIALEPLAALADRVQLAVVGLIHHNKSGSSDPLQVVMASKAFTAVARSVHTVLRDPDDDTGERRLFGTSKNNLGRLDLPTLAFTVASHPVETEDDGTAWTARLDWAGEVEGTISQAMSRAAGNEGDRSATAEATDWLSDYLSSQGSEAAKTDIEKAGRIAGHNVDSIRRARERLHLRYRREGFPSQTIWALPDASHGSPGTSSRAQPVRGEHMSATSATTGADLQKRDDETLPVMALVAVVATPPARDTTVLPPLQGFAVNGQPPRVQAVSELTPSQLDEIAGTPCQNCGARAGHEPDCPNDVKENGGW